MVRVAGLSLESDQVVVVRTGVGKVSVILQRKNRSPAVAIPRKTVKSIRVGGIENSGGETGGTRRRAVLAADVHGGRPQASMNTARRLHGVQSMRGGA